MHKFGSQIFFYLLRFTKMIFLMLFIKKQANKTTSLRRGGIFWV